MIASILFGNIDEDGKLESTYLNEEVRDALGNIADLEKFSRDIVRDASEAGPSGNSLFTDTTPVRPLESAEDFTEIDELADDSDTFKVPAAPISKKPATSLSDSKDTEKILRSATLSNIQKAKLLFPGFAPDKKLRFSQMFGNSFSGRDLDRDWKYGKRKKKYKKTIKENGLWTKSTLDIPKAPPEMIAPGDYEKIMNVKKKPDTEGKKEVVEAKSSDKESEWRNGPGALWYDLANVPKNASSYDYGFKLSTKCDTLEEFPGRQKTEKEEDLYMMYNHLQWEDLVAWDNSQIKSPPAKHMDLLYFSDKMSHYKGVQESILKPTNRKLLDGHWENSIVWDTKNMKHILKTPEVVVDPSTMHKVPIEKERVQESKGTATPKKEYPSKMRMKPLQTVHPLHGELLMDKKPKVTDPFFKISCEEFYQPKPTSTENVLTKYKSMIQHSIPALELELSWFPTYMKPEELRRLHRPYLKPMRTGPHSDPVFKPVYSLERYVRRKENEREAERQKSGGGQVFFMRTREDISAKDGRLVLFEYAEEHPLLMSCIGMASRIKNYCKKGANGDPVNCEDFKYGDQTYNSSPYFLGKLKPGQALQVLDNNMYQSPTYQHSLPHTDFILARTADSFYIRMTDDIFSVGQQFPKIVVPGPNSKRANQHTRNFLQVFIYRLFLESEEVPRRIKMDHIKAAFPAYSESSIRKRLKNCANFNRTGSDCGWWVLQDDFRLPSEEEIRKLVIPEDCCAFYSMQYAEQRLKDAGYGKSIKNLSDDEDEDDSEKILDDEVRIAPWTLTRTFYNALHGKCQLEINGIADPTGIGEGYSYLRVPNKPSVKSNKDVSKEKPKSNEPKSTRTVMGTDSDLRRLTLKNAREVLRSFGVPEADINKMMRWDVINMVRKLSTDKARLGEADGTGKYARGHKYSLIEHQEKYKEDCQRIFDLQTKVLSSTEVLSTDDEESSDEETNIDELGKDLESMLNKKKTMEQINLEREEAERRDLQKLLNQENSHSQPATPASQDKQEDIHADETGRRLIIKRKFSTETGYYYREEVISRPEVIDAYLKIKETADKTNKRYLIDNLDEQQKDEVRKERRRIQEQLRRLNRAAERERMNEKKLKKATKEKAPINMRCGACGETGHMKTNKHCKMYGKSGPVTEDQIIDSELSNVFNEQTSSLVKVEDTKIRIGRAFLAKVDEVSQKAAQKQAQQKRQLEQTIEERAEAKALRKRKKLEKADRKMALKASKTGKHTEHLDYLEPKVKGVNRARVHPEVELRSFFEDLLAKIKEVPRTGAFHKPVSAREIPDYYTVVSIPMDLQTMRNHCINNFYQSREDFLEHLEQIVKNSTIYNGKQSDYTKAAESMLDLAMAEFSRHEDKLQALEEKINPAANKSTQNQFNLILISSVDAMIKVSNSQAFHIPVNAKVAPDYYQVISTPMDLSTLRKNIEKNKYKSRSEFLKDVNLIFENSQQYNGAESLYTKKAEELLGRAKEILQNSDTTLYQYEVLLSCEESASTTLGVNSPKAPTLPTPGIIKGSPESVYSNRIEDEESDQMSESEQFNSSGQKNRYDSMGLEEGTGHTLFEDLMDSEDDSD